MAASPPSPPQEPVTLKHGLMGFVIVVLALIAFGVSIAAAADNKDSSHDDHSTHVEGADHDDADHSDEDHSDEDHNG